MEFGFFYDTPVWLLLAMLIVINVAALEVGFRLGLKEQHKWRDADSGGGNVVLTSMFALLGLILALTFAGGVNRVDSRKQAVVTEANAVSTAFLRAGLFGEPGRTELRQAVYEYGKTRIIDGTMDTHGARMAWLDRTLEAQSRLWPLTEKIIREQPESAAAAPLLVFAMNTLLDEHGTRAGAALDKLPSAVVWLLILVAAASLMVAGFNAGLHGQMSRWRMTLFAGVLGAVMYMIIDLDRPGDGLIRIPQTLMIVTVADMEKGLAR